jgi:hypothetical protein
VISTMPEVGYTLPAAARVIGCHPKHIYKLVNTGELRPYLGLDGRLMLSRDEIYSYLRRKGEL